MEKIRHLICRTPSVVHDWLFELACSLLLPLSTTCKVCNMLRGIGIGVLLGAGCTVALVFVLRGH